MQQMFPLLNTLAHAGEEHGSSAEATTHFISTWYVAVPLFILVSISIFIVTRAITKRTDVALMALATTMLVAGFVMYAISPIISILSITIGFGLAGFLSLVGLKAPEHTKKGAK